MQDDLRPGCGSKAGLLLVAIVVAIVAAVAIWAWSDKPPDTPNAPATGAPAAVPGGSGAPAAAPGT